MVEIHKVVALVQGPDACCHQWHNINHDPHHVPLDPCVANLVAAHNKGFGSAATVNGRNALSEAERGHGVAMTAVGHDANLIAAHNKGFGSAATFNRRNSLSEAVRGAVMKATGRDANLVAAHNKGFISAASSDERSALCTGNSSAES